MGQGGLRLVLPGSHEQYLQWLATGGGLDFGVVVPWRPITKEADLMGLGVMEVVSFDQIGTYWDNAAFGSDVYRQFMAVGVRLDKHWAHPWDVDWRRAEALRTGRHDDTDDPSARVLARHERLMAILRGESPPRH